MSGLQAPADVLIVDDEPTLCILLEAVVTRAGGRAASATSVAGAKALLAERAFDCALLDKNLPDGSGIDLLRFLKEAHPETEVMMLTGYANLDSAIDALRLGAFDYIVKPFDVEVLSHRIKMAVERRRMRLENRTMQGLLVQADRMASLGTLAAGVAHEINNPLAFLLSNLEFIERELPLLCAQLPPEELQVKQAAELGLALREAREGAERVRFIVGDLKTFARADEGPGGPIDVRAVLQSAAKMVRSQLVLRAGLVLDYQPVPSVTGSEGRLAQVFLNLLVNASQAIPAGDPTRHQVRVRTRTDGDGMAVIEVEDTGAGVAPDVRNRIFEPFFTPKPVGVGTGLGLSICHGIIAAMGGRIEVDSPPGAGATFRVVLPPSREEDGAG